MNETFHVQTDDELIKKELKQIEADDQAIQTILLGLPEDIYAAVDSCETAQEIWLRVQQMMKGFKEVDELKAAKTQDPLALMATSNNPYIFLVPHQDQPSFNQNYIQRPMPNPKDITDPTTAMNMALALMAKAFKLNYSTLTNNNQRISSNPRNRHIAQPGMNMGQDRQMQIVEGNGENQFRQYAGPNNPRVQNIRNQYGLIVVSGTNQNPNGNGNLVAARAKGNATGHNGNQTRCYNCRGQASTSGTQTDKAPVYDSDGSAEYTELLEPVTETHQVPQNDNNVIFKVTGVEQSRGTVEQHPTNVEETRVLYDSLYHNLAIKLEKVNTVNRKLKEINAELTTELARFKNQEKCFEISEEKYDKLERCYQKSIYQEQCLSKKINALHLSFEAAKFVGDFKSFVKEVDESLAKHKALELEIERLLKAVVSKDIMSVVQNNSIGEISNLQTELERTKERFENCIIKNENEYAKLWNDWYKKCEECNFDKISYDKAYNDMQQKIKRLGDLKGKSKDTLCVSDTLNPLSQKLKNENVELEFQVLNYDKENAHLKTTYKNQFDSISLTRTQTKTIIISFQNKLHNTIYENVKLRAQLFNKVSVQKDNTRGTSANTKFAKQSIMGNLSKIGETHAMSKPATSNSSPTPQESKVVKNDKEVVNSDSNGLSSTGIDNTKTRRPLPRSNTKNDRVPSASKSSCNKNKGVEVEEHHRNILLSKNKKHMSSACNNVKFDSQNVKSKGSFVIQDLEVAFRRNACFIKNFKGVDLLKGDRSKNLYTINLHEMASVSSIYLMARASSTKSWLWHQILSHLNFDTINDLAKNDLISGLPKFKYHKEHLCSSCEQGKSKSASHPPKPVPNSRQRLHLLHMDLCGLMRIANINGKRVGISHQVSSVRTTQQNGVVERRNQTLVESARTMLIFSRAPLFLWAENDRDDIGKLGAKGDIGFFIGYYTDSCAFRVYNRKTKKIKETMNVSFDELLAMAFEQRSSKPRLQNMTSGKISSGLDLTYAPSTITTQQPTEGEFDLLFEAMYDDHIGGQPSATSRTDSPAQAPQNDREDIGKLGAKGDIGFFIGYSADSCAYRVYNRRTKRIIETVNVSFDELSAMDFEQRSSKPRLQSMTYGHISSGLDLTYAPLTITMQQPSEGELDLLFEAMYDDYISGQPLATARTVPPAQEPQVPQLSTTSTTLADTAPIPTNSSSHATNIPITSQDIDELNPNAMVDGNTFVNPLANSSTSAAASSSSQKMWIHRTCIRFINHTLMNSNGLRITL
nr:retrovirus-related Pol polyprotein from transposon TNT 1-94 [Tanacetum cinerariifolium]